MPSEQKSEARWILEWEDRSRDPDRHVHVIADNLQEVRNTARRLLSGETWTPPEAHEIGGDMTEDAYAAFIREEMNDDSDDAYLQLWSQITFNCDEGVLKLLRER